jgi:hypothetical protein
MPTKCPECGDLLEELDSFGERAAGRSGTSAGPVSSASNGTRAGRWWRAAALRASKHQAVDLARVDAINDVSIEEMNDGDPHTSFLILSRVPG